MPERVATKRRIIHIGAITNPNTILTHIMMDETNLDEIDCFPERGVRPSFKASSAVLYGMVRCKPCLYRRVKRIVTSEQQQQG
jgi:hypothetical protein|mmetsp:Transcript_3161/g.6969  ORF Transcript_3161/g.6969 Transcript_3161/m.6969 type:complete len:83 (+) Transcript_3161:3012-3260(+)